MNGDIDYSALGSGDFRPTPNARFICGADTYELPSDWQRFWRKFGFYKSVFSQSATITLPKDYINFGDILEITSVYSLKGKQKPNDFKKQCRKMAKYFKNCILFDEKGKQKTDK